MRVRGRADDDRRADRGPGVDLHGQARGHAGELLGPTFHVVGLEKRRITISGGGIKATFDIEGVGQARGDTLKNPVTGEDHSVYVDLPGGFIWRRGQCGQGTFKAKSGPVSPDFVGTSWIRYEFDWKN